MCVAAYNLECTFKYEGKSCVNLTLSRFSLRHLRMCVRLRECMIKFKLSFTICAYE